MIRISTISWDWKSQPSKDELTNAMKKFGVRVYEDPCHVGSDQYGYIFSDRDLSKSELELISEQERCRRCGEVYVPIDMAEVNERGMKRVHDMLIDRDGKRGPILDAERSPMIIPPGGEDLGPGEGGLLKSFDPFQYPRPGGPREPTGFPEPKIGKPRTTK